MAMRVKNIQYGTTVGTGPNRVFHPWRGSPDYDPSQLDKRSAEYKRATARRKKKATGRKAKPKAKVHRKRTVKAAGRKRNPIPVKWATAKVRKVGNDIQVMLFPKKTVKRRNPSIRRRVRSARTSWAVSRAGGASRTTAARAALKGLAKRKGNPKRKRTVRRRR